MPTKPNRAGEPQNYVPEGNGDASGEYGDNESGSNVHFKAFKKPEETAAKPKRRTFVENKNLTEYEKHDLINDLQEEIKQGIRKNNDNDALIKLRDELKEKVNMSGLPAEDRRKLQNRILFGFNGKVIHERRKHDFFKDANSEFEDDHLTKYDSVIDKDNIVLRTNNIKTYDKHGETKYLLVVGNNQAVYLNDWQIKKGSNQDDISTYFVKLNRNYFKPYTFRNGFDDFSFNKDDSFDDLLNVAKEQGKYSKEHDEAWDLEFMGHESPVGGGFNGYAKI